MLLRAIDRYFRLREVAREMGLDVAWWWSNARVLQAIFDERIRREIKRKERVRSIFSLPKPRAILDFRTTQQMPSAKKAGN